MVISHIMLVPDALPRDILLNILSRLDMDGRIQCRIVHRIRIPETLRTRLHMVLTHRIHMQLSCTNTVCAGHPWRTYHTRLGPASPTTWLDRWYGEEFPVEVMFFDYRGRTNHTDGEARLSVSYRRSGRGSLDHMVECLRLPSFPHERIHIPCIHAVTGGNHIVH